MPRPQKALRPADSPPIRLADLEENEYIFKRHVQRVFNAKELRIREAYASGSPLSEIIRRFAIAPGNLLALLEIDPKDPANLEIIRSVEGAYAHIRTIIQRVGGPGPADRRP